jgi:hypothetical protein
MLRGISSAFTSVSRGGSGKETVTLVHFHKSQLDSVLDLGPGYVGKAGHQELIDAEQALAGVGDNAVVFKEFIVFF